MSRLRDETIRIRTRLESTTVPIKQDRVQSSSKGDAFADQIAFLADKSRLYDQLVYEYEVQRAEIVAQLLGMEDQRSADALYKRFVQGKAVRVVAAEMHYSDKYMSRIITEALREFEVQYLK